MGANEIFKTEFRGYSKAEVTDYIMSLNAQMESLKAELDTAESRLAKCQKELDEYKTEETVRELTNEELEAMRQSVREELEPVLTREIASRLEEKYKSVVEQCVREDKEKNEQYREKAAAYDEQREILAELMIKAKADAADICCDAQNKSEKLLADTFDKFLKMRADFDEMKSNVMASKTELDTRIKNIQHTLNDFSQYLDFIGRDIENTGDNFKENM